MAGVTPDNESGYQKVGDADKEKLMADAKSRTMNNAQRALEFVKDLKDGEDTPLKQNIRLCFKWSVKPLILIAWAYIKIMQFGYKIYLMLPMNIVQCIFGVGLCFFGGVYFASIAAFEAANNFGGAALINELTVIYNEGCRVKAKSDEDDKVDDDADGTADVQQITFNELLNRKSMLAMKSVEDPHRLMKAMEFLMSAYIAVLETLKFQFAKTVALALAIADMLCNVLVKFIAPPLAMLLGPELKHWAPTMIETAAKVTAVVMASFIQSIISAFYSGLRGGKLFAEGLINIAGERGLMDKLPDAIVTKPFDANKSFIDEIIAYPLAAGGFYYQFTHGFMLEFPYSLALAPLTVIEMILRWQIFT